MWWVFKVGIYLTLLGRSCKLRSVVLLLFENTLRNSLPISLLVLSKFDVIVEEFFLFGFYWVSASFELWSRTSLLSIESGGYTCRIRLSAQYKVSESIFPMRCNSTRQKLPILFPLLINKKYPFLLLRWIEKWTLFHKLLIPVVINTFRTLMHSLVQPGHLNSG